MNPLLLVIAGGLAILTIWGFISPRGQWRVLGAWTRREPYANEPGAGLVAIQRIVAGIAIIVLGTTGWSMYSTYVDSQPTPPPPPGPVEQMWGAPAPKVVNRVFTPLESPPAGLVNEKVLGYQPVNGTSRDPQYLFSLDHLIVKDASQGIGYLGHAPQAGLTALDTADLVVEVRGDSACIPQQVVVDEGDDVVRVAVYYGQPNPSDGSNAVNLAHCSANPKADKARTVLVPIDLAETLGDRKVVTFDGSKKIPVVPLKR
ncbi:hypothetical protein [Parafrigoribacterium soli]|uniref:hypothetical protein n=1 Tax=Parafrigoribacterium soli TaxID=3144663 RepID=UPI0032ED447F